MRGIRDKGDRGLGPSLPHLTPLDSFDSIWTLGPIRDHGYKIRGKG